VKTVQISVLGARNASPAQLADANPWNQVAPSTVRADSPAQAVDLALALAQQDDA